jgi:hypothetical protein
MGPSRDISPLWVFESEKGADKPVKKQKKPLYPLDESRSKLFLYPKYDYKNQTVRPDYAHKRFGDGRTRYVLLIVALAQDFPAAPPI